MLNGCGVVFVDLDATVWEQPETWDEETVRTAGPPALLPGVKEKLQQWHLEGRAIFYTTARRDVLQELTEEHIRYHGLPFDRIIMNINGGPRVLINNQSADGAPRTYAYDLVRNSGLGSVELEALTNG
jgi:hypothetical protein